MWRRSRSGLPRESVVILLSTTKHLFSLKSTPKALSVALSKKDADYLSERMLQRSLVDTAFGKPSSPTKHTASVTRTRACVSAWVAFLRGLVVGQPAHP